VTEITGQCQTRHRTCDTPSTGFPYIWIRWFGRIIIYSFKYSVCACVHVRVCVRMLNFMNYYYWLYYYSNICITIASSLNLSMYVRVYYVQWYNIIWNEIDIHLLIYHGIPWKPGIYRELMKALVERLISIFLLVVSGDSVCLYLCM
jgi:hypothetical protein